MTRGSRWRSKLTEVTSMLVLGAGLLLLFEPGLAPVDFWVVWILGFAVLVPTVELLLDVDDDREDESDRGDDAEDRSDRPIPEGTDADTRDAIETLRERYARGDLTDGQFERKLDRLLQTDTLENAAEWRERATDVGTGAATDRGADDESGDETGAGTDHDAGDETDGAARAETDAE